ncbi:RNA polymerase sigma-I factor [Paraliobacillus sediminis]|uniref:RNA polymerase sigma-I factor n=1 Tax=Paraliobacillus sediminis TaxID=1885916 RepID=UPI000E3CB26F|nr:RNA polymerase sigma-I factor [Paraliobacillus sediminis]
MKNLADMETATLERQVHLVQLGDRKLQNKLLKAYKPYIAKCVSEVCKRYINPSRDDEFSVGLFAFNEAMNGYSSEKGSSFLSFAQLIIKRKTIDYIRKESARLKVISLDENFDNVMMDNPIEINVANKVDKFNIDQWNRRNEILMFATELSYFHLSISELMRVSPKHKDARESAIQVARTLYQNEKMREFVQTKKKIPITQLMEYVTVSKKTLERNRKYILAIFIVLDGDFLYIKEYIKGVGRLD